MFLQINLVVNAYSFGMTLPGRTSTGNDYRYSFQGQEKDDELKGIGNSYDFGARMYDPRIGRWFATDPKQKFSPDLSPYVYCFNNGILYNDPNGEWPKIRITDQVTGYTIQRVYGLDFMFSVPAIVVPTYKAIIYDVQDDGVENVVGTFNVTRDGWYNLGSTEKGYHLLNRTFEPENSNENLYNLVGVEEYPSGSGAAAYKLTRTKDFKTGEQTTTIPAMPLATNDDDDGNPIKDARKDNSKASGVMIHIGSYYDVDSYEWLGGSFGCFSFIPKFNTHKSTEEAKKASNEDDYDDKTSNEDWRKVVKLLNKLQAEDGYKKFQLVIKKRENVVKEKEVEKKEVLSE